jgi:hypothetical protein
VGGESRTAAGGQIARASVSPASRDSWARKPSTTCFSDQLGPNIKTLVGNADPTHADYGFGLAVRATPCVVPKEEFAVVYLSAAPGPLHWRYRQKINTLVYRAMID